MRQTTSWPVYRFPHGAGAGMFNPERGRPGFTPGTVELDEVASLGNFRPHRVPAAEVDALLENDEYWVINHFDCVRPECLRTTLWACQAPRTVAGQLAEARRLPRYRVSQYVLDTGASYHIINKGAIASRSQREYAAPRPVGLDTANGKINLSMQVDTDVEVLSLQLTALIADRASNLISLGRLCMEQNCTFIWHPGSHPRLWDADGREVKVEVHHFVPYLDPQIGSQSYVVQSVAVDVGVCGPDEAVVPPYPLGSACSFAEAAVPAVAGGIDEDGGAVPAPPSPSAAAAAGRPAGPSRRASRAGPCCATALADRAFAHPPAYAALVPDLRCFQDEAEEVFPQVSPHSGCLH